MVMAFLPVVTVRRKKVDLECAYYLGNILEIIFNKYTEPTMCQDLCDTPRKH